MDTFVTGGTLLTMRDDRLGIVDSGALAVTDGRLSYVGPAAEAPAPSDADEVVDAEGSVVMPGLVNAHTHMAHTLLRGGAQDVPEIEWMNRALGPLSAHADEHDRVAGTRLGVLEAVRGGATTICEYASEVETLVEEVYQPLGVDVVAVETINEVPEERDDLGPRELYPFDREQGERALARADRLFEQFGDDPLVTPAYGPQALDMVSPDLLRTVQALAHERGAKLHLHTAQGEREAIQIEERYGADESTVSVLEELGIVEDSLVAVHCHGATPAEREQLAAGGAAMLGCPSSISAIDGIVPPVAEFREYGAPVGIGTDQAPGPGHHSMFREARTAATLSKVEHTDPTALTAPEALRLATVGGAAALGIADEVGTLEAGTRADFVVVETDRLSTAPAVESPLHTAVPNLVYSTTGREVRDVFVAGEAVLRDGAFVDADPEAAVAEATERARALYERASGDWRAADSALVDAVDGGWL
ncbi:MULTISPECIES: amidohydrolase family protein [Halolamina]|uniref:5-methylthioadenosine/S-adenosylhomocysteine deaminase n=1 Tax=Halolamina pelagica TaxID=699431 RepID=A0A1I5RV71_9EURY|nr:MULTISPECIES: amidohydrolase family protein [Halolamina]NHX35350.1 amidohydrolase family protein [Halolamina sp. R1-12]SFP62141.1 5-methylthioadenosine/S-adenosylhomocysteine deaminase [Halolamina pelagica]